MRIKRYDMTPELLKMFLDGNKRTIQATKNALPKDAELVRVSTKLDESSVHTISLFYCSSEYPDLPEGTILKPKIVEMTQSYGDSK